MEAGMFTYLLMSLPFLGMVLVLDYFVLKTRVVRTKQCWQVVAIMVGLTAVFDQVLAGLPIVHYNEAKTLGLYIWHAPIEDFLYPVAAVIGLASLDRKYGKR
jgi:lycopene cyclase domain-containing protein